MNTHNTQPIQSGSEHNQAPSRRHPGKAAKFIAGLAFVGTVAGFGAYAINKEQAHNLHEERLAAQASIDGFTNSDIVLKDGSALRSAPNFDTGNTPEDTSVIERVKGVMLVRGAAVSSEHPGWASFVVVKDGTDPITTPDERADAAVWVNLTELENQDHASVLDSAVPVSAAKAGGTLAASVDSQGALSVETYGALQNVGVAQQLTNDQFNAVNFVLGNR